MSDIEAKAKRAASIILFGKPDYEVNFPDRPYHVGYSHNELAAKIAAVAYEARQQALREAAHWHTSQLIREDGPGWGSATEEQRSEAWRQNARHRAAAVAILALMEPSK